MRENTTEDKSYLQTVGRTLEILELIGMSPGLTLSEASKLVGMSTTVAYRILFTLTTAGFLRQEPYGKRYYLGDKALMLGMQSLDNSEIKRIAQYYMWEYYEQTGETCILTVPCNGYSVCIEKIGSLRDSSNSIRAGGIYPLHKGASNRVQLAFFPQQEREAYLDSLSMDDDEREMLSKKLGDIVENGYDFSIGTLNSGRYGLGFPVFDRYKRLAGAFSTGGYVDNLNEKSQQSLVRRLSGVASKINFAMGSVPVIE